MKAAPIFLFFFLLSTLSYSQQKDWPVLKHYDQDHLAKIALPLGGIGTGTVSIGGRGDLRDWEVMNRPAKGFLAGPGGNRAPFFAIYTQVENEAAQSRALMGPIPFNEYESMEGRGAANHGLPRFRECSFDAAYPFGQINLRDKDMPVKVKMQVFNPLIPGDVDASSIPIAILRYVVTNTTNKKISTAVCGVMENFIGADGKKGREDWKGDFHPGGAYLNKNVFKKGEAVQGIYMYSDGVEEDAEQWGTMALSTDAKSGVSYRTNTIKGGWGNALLHFWDDFSGDGQLTERKWKDSHTPQASLAVKTELMPQQSKAITFYLTWNFPNRMAWASSILKNYYSTQYADAWEVAENTIPQLPELENKTIDFVAAFCNSDLPEVVKESALFNISTLRSQTCFRTADGNFFGWEGTMDKVGSCMGSCTHVWNYEQTTPFLFGELAKTMRMVEFDHATADNGVMSFRVNLPLEHAKNYQLAAADGQMGTIMKVYRDWQLSGDNEMLKKLWPNIKKALAFAWVEGGWDANNDGVMEGCQHNTMDVEYYGPNPQMQLWYLGALRAAEKMALFMNDKAFAQTCRTLYLNGSIWTDKNLFNGEYYIHKVQPIKNPLDIIPYVRAGMGATNLEEPDYQLDNGCLVDQLVGQYMAHICGLGYLVKPDNIRKTLKSIMKYNYKPSFHDHFNNMRSYVLGDEAGLLMAYYPSERPKQPFPYFSEVMTGFEYTAAVGMLYEGHTEDGLLCIKNVRDRYDGLKRSPFDEAECGHHYARAMAAWAEVLALTGFYFSAVEGSINFQSSNAQNFWTNGYTYGTATISGNKESKSVVLKVLNGELKLRKINLNGFGTLDLEDEQKIREGESKSFALKNNDPKVGLPVYEQANAEKIKILHAPVIKNLKGEIVKNLTFTDKVKVSLESDIPNARIYYTTDGSLPNLKSKVYRKALEFDSTIKLRAITSLNNKTSTFSASANLYKIKAYKQLSLKSPASKKYAGKSELSLVDGELGTENYLDVEWLGFEGEDMELLIEFNQITSISSFIASCLQNNGSWIFLPKEREFYASNDGKSFSKIQSVKEEISVKPDSYHLFEVKNTFEPTETKFLKIIIKNIGICPDDHPGAGNKAWLFVDEIMIE